MRNDAHVMPVSFMHVINKRQISIGCKDDRRLRLQPWLFQGSIERGRHCLQNVAEFGGFCRVEASFDESNSPVDAFLPFDRRIKSQRPDVGMLSKSPHVGFVARYPRAVDS